MSYSMILKEDFSYIYDKYNFSILRNTSFFITGATGLIGKQLIYFFDFLNSSFNYEIKIFALVRDLNKAELIFQDLEAKSLLKFVVGDIKSPINISEKIDYVIHGASITSSRMFIERPVETIDIAVNGTLNVLNFAKDKNIKSMVYLSSMEVFGITDNNLKEVRENDLGYIDILSPRSSYSEGKRICENLCACYACEYKVPVKAARLAQTFGPGIDYNDSRVCAMFARSVVEHKDIVLKTEGKTKRPALYTMDAVTGILTLLIKGNSGESYTIANPETFVSIKDIAEMIVSRIANNEIKLVFEIGNKAMFAPDLNMNLTPDKIKKLGWIPTVGLEEAYRKMISYMRETK